MYAAARGCSQGDVARGLGRGSTRSLQYHSRVVSLGASLASWRPKQRDHHRWYRMSFDTLPIDVTAGAAVLGAVAALVGAIAAVCGVRIAARELPPIRRRLTASEFVVGELDGLIRMSASEPDAAVKKPRELPDPILLREVRVGRHDPVFDRIVFVFVQGVPGYEIVPLTTDELKEKDLQGAWGLSVAMNPCRVRYVDGPNESLLSIEDTRGYPNFPAVTDHRLVREGETECEWAIGSPYKTRYFAFELDDPPRLVVDFFRQTSA